MTTTLRILSGGFRSGWYIPLDQDGYFAGATGSLTPGPDNGQAGYYMVGVKTAPYKAIEPLVLLATGEDQPQGQIVEPPQSFPSFDITGSILDLTLSSLAQSGKTFTIGNAVYAVIQPYLPNYINAAFQGQRLALSKDAATQGLGIWDGVLFPKIQMVPMGSDGMSEKKITDFKYHVICNPSSIFPDGTPVNATNFLTTNGVEFPFSSPNKLMYFGWKGDGTNQVYNMPATSIPGSNLLAPGYPVVARVEGVLATPTITLVGSNYEFDFGAPVGSGDRAIVQVEYL